ncbi:M15 family metallopeptidase [Pseudonocardia endophytica]|uniref:D-alanyl-D-alanine carboxypeptidase-like protein n=1 Tax=Pseudonocardia endophytica TaxID=401976 RepID=A0A4R1HTG1_PSEEN|nr:M15 family metallopeptidase [Pseudonocardia endophytica]TCK24603.1 D-alanyl-D-alanine carboxypeptidase-like protein [Pseudonocardia endophytica]
MRPVAQALPAGRPNRRLSARRARTALLAAVAAVVVALLVALIPHLSPVTESGGPADRAAPAPRTAAGGAALPGVADGVVTGSVGVSDDVPAVTGLDPDLRSALRRAATDAARSGVTVRVTSGWRSARYQEQLLEEAVARYGSKAEAARWVATADTSLHVSGEAVDIGHSDAIAWMSRHGDTYGLCRIYRNEPWHYELRPDAADDGCPTPYADPTHDPRMQP